MKTKEGLNLTVCGSAAGLLLTFGEKLQSMLCCFSSL